MLKQRVITACVLLLVLLVAVLGFSVVGFQIFIALMLALAAWEWSRLGGLQLRSWRLRYIAVFLALLYLTRANADAVRFIITVGILWWLLAWVLIKLYPAFTHTWHRTPLLLVMGLLVLLPGWLSLLYLRDSPGFRQYVF